MRTELVNVESVNLDSSLLTNPNLLLLHMQNGRLVNNKKCCIVPQRCQRDQVGFIY